MVQRRWHPSPRTAFIVREGILRRGIVIGLLVTMLFVATDTFHGAFTNNHRETIVLIVLCLIEWTVGAGWIIGSFLWSRHILAASRSSTRPRDRGRRRDRN